MMTRKNHEMTRKNLIRKGHNTSYDYMRKQGYNLLDCVETSEGYEVEWYKSHAGITLDTVIVVFSKSYRVIDVK